MSAKPATGHGGTDQALDDFTTRWGKALLCFQRTDIPQWKRTQAGMMCFKALRFEGLPRKLQRRIDRHFARINDVLARYPLKTWDNYQQISAADLTAIEKLIDSLVCGD